MGELTDRVVAALPATGLENRPATQRSGRAWKDVKAARAAHAGLVGPMKCLYCGHIANTLRGMGAHIGWSHKDRRTDHTRPVLVGTDFEDLKTGVVDTKKKRKYTKRAGKKTAGQQIRRALVDGKPGITLEFPLSDDITIRVPLILGPPTFIERNGDG